MPVTDEQVAVLRTYLTDDLDEHRRLYARLDTADDRSAYATLLTAAFLEAVDRRFAEGGTMVDVIEFAASVRIRSMALAEAVDPRAAERLILAALTDEDISDLTDTVKGGLCIVLLAALTSDEGYSAAGLDEFLAEARKLADGWMQR
jgi:hypothetical protein